MSGRNRTRWLLAMQRRLALPDGKPTTDIIRASLCARIWSTGSTRGCDGRIQLCFCTGVECNARTGRRDQSPRTVSAHRERVDIDWCTATIHQCLTSHRYSSPHTLPACLGPMSGKKWLFAAGQQSMEDLDYHILPSPSGPGSG